LASAAEHLVANVNFAAFSKARELHKRLLFTLGVLVVYRLGTYIPIPGTDPTTFAQAFGAYNVSFYLGGASLLIAVSVTIDFLLQIQSHLVAHQYEGMLRKVSLRRSSVSHPAAPGAVLQPRTSQ
jgi:preprotein translocase subunit SecY